MNEASQWRLALARKIAPVYTANAKVQAMVVGGSAARGCADRYSDVEIGVFWNEPATDAELKAAMEQLRGKMWELDPYSADEDVWYEEYEARGVKIDLRHMTMARVGDVLAAVVDERDTSEDRQTIVSTLQHAVTLHGAPVVEKWQARVAHYPDALAHAMVGQHLSLNPWWSVSMLAERGDLHLVYGAFGQATRAILGALMGVNRIYHPGFKWMNRTSEEMAWTPPNLAARLRQVFHKEPLEGSQQMQQLVEETFDVVAEQMPELDLVETRRNFLYCRPTLDCMPEGGF